ncbi:interleukin-7 receptor subunit alpha [Anarhichas minor]|uniref:interleukin-7 receptor subunit alpha n=1 Tax=Anarhichas minor TaxID=65739 RepID=UPI003F73F0A7
MLLCCWIAALLLLLPAVSRTESGDGDDEPTISCSSHIMRTGSSLSCRLVGGRNNHEDDDDDQDEEDDGIRNMTVCFIDFSQNEAKVCLEAFGDNVSSVNLNPVCPLTVTVHLKRGGRITTTVNLMKIVQPRSPQVKNVTFDLDSHQAVIRLQTPYLNDYIRVDNQLFQLHIWWNDSTITQNVSSDTLKIHMEHLRKHTEYKVEARSIPVNGLQGSWSKWSEPSTFITPAEEEEEEEDDEEEDEVQKQTDERRETNKLIVCLIVLVVVPSSVVFFCKNKIFTYMWPSIPHPKHTLVQICKTNKGLLLNFKPEEFSALKVEKTEKQSCEDAEPPIAAEAAADDIQSNPSCSTQSSDGSRSTTSVGTEELELSALLSRSSSSDGEDGFRSIGPSPVEDLRLGERPLTPQPECSSGGNEAEAYVTMSSFYQIK